MTDKPSVLPGRTVVWSKYPIFWPGLPGIPFANNRLMQNETAFQIACVLWLRIAQGTLKEKKANNIKINKNEKWLSGCSESLISKLRPEHAIYFDRWHHSANERVGARAGLLARLMGQSKGFPDLVQLELRAAIELKLPDGILSTEQKSWLTYLRSIGWHVEVIRSLEDFKNSVLKLVIKHG